MIDRERRVKNTIQKNQNNKSRQKNYKWLIAITMSLVTFLGNVDATAVNLALPAIATDFHAELAQMQWVVSGYIIAAAMFIIAGGYIAERLGRKNICIAGVIIFILGSYFSGIAISPVMLVIARMFQGLGTALFYPCVFVMTLAAFPKKQHGIAFALLNSVTAVSWVAGPAMGGVILHFLSWQWIFYINIPLGLIAVAATYYFCPKLMRKQSAANNSAFDLKGLIVLVLWLMTLLVALNQMTEWGVLSAKFLCLTAVSILFFIVFVKIEFRVKQPLLQLNLMKSKQVIYPMFIRMVFLFALNALLFSFVFYLQNVLAFSSLKAGEILLYMMVVFGIVSPFSGKLIDYFDPIKPTIVAMFLYLIAFALFASLGAQANYYLIIPALILAGITSSIIFSSTYLLATSAVKEEQSGIMASIVITGGFISAALGTAVTGTLQSINGARYFFSHIGSLREHFTTDQLSYLASLASGVHPFSVVKHSFSIELVGQIMPLLKKSYLHGFTLAMSLCAFLSFVAFVLAIQLNKKG